MTLQRNNFILYKTIFLDFTLYVGQHKKKKGGILTHPQETTYKIFRFLYASQSKKDKGIAGVHHSFHLLV